jgi:surface protein
MFSSAFDFNKDIGNWDVSNVINMSYMFNSAIAFNQDIGDWNVCSVTNMSYMFCGSNLLQDLSDWTLPLISNTPSCFHNSSAWGNLSSAVKPQWGAPCASPSIAAPDLTDWNTNSTIEGQGNALNLSDGNGISIYPNPTTGIINLKPVPEGTYRLYNEIGRLMDQGKIQPRFDLSNFENGIYMLLLQTENESKYFKVIKQ